MHKNQCILFKYIKIFKNLRISSAIFLYTLKNYNELTRSRELAGKAYALNTRTNTRKSLTVIQMR